MSEDRCPTFLGYRFHRYPCAESGQIDTLTVTPTDQPEEVRCGGEGRSGALRWLDCRCGHANADHWDGGECAHKGCMCGAPYDDEETP